MDLRKEFHSESNTFRLGDELALIFSVKLMRRSLVSRNGAWGVKIKGFWRLWRVWGSYGGPHAKESARGTTGLSAEGRTQVKLGRF